MGSRQSGPGQSGPGQSGPGQSGPGQSGPGQSGSWASEHMWALDPFHRCLFISPNIHTTAFCVILERAHFDKERMKNLK